MPTYIVLFADDPKSIQPTGVSTVVTAKNETHARQLAEREISGRLVSEIQKIRER